MSQTHPPCYTSLGRLLAPAALARATGHARPPRIVTREAIAGGLSGARLERLTLGAGTHTDPAAGRSLAEAPASYILKRLDPRANWLMRASGDGACREARLTQSPLWQRLPPEIWVPVLACALAADGTGALLMPDLAAHLFTEKDCYGPADMALAERILDALAALHASCWETAELRTSLWLASPADTLLAITPARLRAVARDDGPPDEDYATRALSLWSRLPELIGARAAGVIQRAVDKPARIIAALAAAPATLAHGDCWLANLGEHAGRLILLDWGLCTAGPATLDSLCLAGTWRALDPDAILASHRVALLRRGVAAVADDQLWELLCDLGWVRATLMDLEGLVWDVVSPESPVPHAVALSLLQRWCGRAVAVLERRGW